LNCQVRPSGDVVQLSASHGVGVPTIGSGLTRPSKISSQTLRELAESSSSGFIVIGSPDDPNTTVLANCPAPLGAPAGTGVAVAAGAAAVVAAGVVAG